MFPSERFLIDLKCSIVESITSIELLHVQKTMVYPKIRRLRAQWCSKTLAMHKKQIGNKITPSNYSNTLEQWSSSWMEASIAQNVSIEVINLTRGKFNKTIFCYLRIYL